MGHIVPGGAADLDGRLCTGDEMMSVDGQSVINTSHHHVVQLMARAAAAGRVTLGIRRRIPSHGKNCLFLLHSTLKNCFPLVSKLQELQ